MCTLHSFRPGKAQQPPTALFINSIQERRIHSNQRHATHIHVCASSNKHISSLCTPDFCIFHSFLEDPGTNVVGTRKNRRQAYTHTHTM